jgi:hypothetical protein
MKKQKNSKKEQLEADPTKSSKILALMGSESIQ